MGPKQPEDAPNAPRVAARYRHLLAAPPARTLESARTAGAESAPDLSDGAIAERIDHVDAVMREMISDRAGDQASAQHLAAAAIAEARDALRALRDNPDRLAAQPPLRAALETIVCLDGSRPSFVVRHGEPVRESSPLGQWEPFLDASAELLGPAIACVGRLDVPGLPQGFGGTGFLVQDDLVLTNRHVLQIVADRDEHGHWHFKADAAIDFGHEHEGDASLGRRRLRRVAFCGSRHIQWNKPVDHTIADVALLELEPAAPSQRPRYVLPLDISTNWAHADQVIYAIGYPGAPSHWNVFTPALLHTLFQSTYGCKRIAPGLMLSPSAALAARSGGHDATTLRGSSGSVILVAGYEGAAAGLHYGGSPATPRENWAHLIGRLLDEPSGCDSIGPGATGATPWTFLDALRAYNVTLIPPRRRHEETSEAAGG